MSTAAVTVADWCAGCQAVVVSPRSCGGSGGSVSHYVAAGWLTEERVREIVREELAKVAAESDRG